MAIDDGGTSRFPFVLAIVRYVVATVVTVLTLVVVVMVITVALRPEDIRLSILQGYIEADTLWRQVTRSTTTIIHSEARKPRNGPSETWVPFDDQVEHDTYYKPAMKVNLMVSLSTGNPSGRADITCDNIIVRVLDMPGGNITGMVNLDTFPLPDRFTVERQSSHTVRTLLILNSTRALSYIADNYGGMSSFQAMVQVNATVSPSPTTRGNTISQYCWPVTVATFEPTFAGDDVQCKPSKEIGYTIPPALPA